MAGMLRWLQIFEVTLQLNDPFVINFNFLFFANAFET